MQPMFLCGQKLEKKTSFGTNKLPLTPFVLYAF